MANILWCKLDKEEQEIYLNRIKALGVLSGLFKDLEGENGNKPYLHYRNHEISFIDSFNNVKGITRKDSAFDAIAKVGNENIGIGLKTWIHNSDCSNQKVAEFNKKSKELRELFSAGKDKELVYRIAELRNNRIDDDKRLYETDLDIYHFITRDNNVFYVIESYYEKIDIDNIKDINKTDTSISFNDGKNHYLFNMSKSTLFKKFNASQEERVLSVPLEIHNETFSILDRMLNNSNDEMNETNINLNIGNNLTSILESNFIILPLYNDRNYLVNKKSGFNASLASSKTRGSNKPRPAYEAYANIPVYIHHLYPNFFGFNALDRDERSESKFNLHLPNGNIISAKITQDNGKGLQTKPQSILGKWLLFSIFGLEEYEMLTRELINEKEIDSIKITKIDNDNFKVEICNYLEYERWKYNHKEKIQNLIQHEEIRNSIKFRTELIAEVEYDES